MLLLAMILRSNLFRIIFLVGLFQSPALKAVETIPDYEQVKAEYSLSDQIFYDRSGILLQSQRVNFQFRSIGWVEKEEVPDHFIRALVHSEDKEFWEHSGVNSLSFLSSLAQWFRGGKVRGASTITMQWVGMYYSDLKPRKGTRSFSQKLKQIQRAAEWEEQWTKDQLLTAYLNWLPFRGEIRGLKTASFAFLSKSTKSLTPNESYLLVAMIRSPNADLEQLEKRACKIKNELEKDSDCSEFKNIIPFFQKAELTNYTLNSFNLGNRGHWESISGFTTISHPLQSKILELIQNHIKPLASKNVHEAAVLVIENQTGEILAYVSNVSWSLSKEMDLIQIKRQAGSTLKPFVYAEAFETKKLTPASLLEDSKAELQDFQGTYRPSNYDHSFRGVVTVRQALGSSLNIPAVKSAQMLDQTGFVEKLRKLDFSDLKPAYYYGPSLALGTADVSLLELTNAYRALANGGVLSNTVLFLPSLPNQSIEKEKLLLDKNLRKETRVFREEVAYLITSILSDREARSLSFGWESSLSTSFPTAVKTGTSQDMRDNWCIGYSPTYTVGVWVGNANGEPMHDVTGITGAGPIWRETMEILHEKIPRKLWQIPKNITFDSAQNEFFETGVEIPTEAPSLVKPKFVKITAPIANSIFGLDPDIPQGRQKLFLKLNSYDKSLWWFWNGTRLNEAAGPYPLDLVPGEHQIQIRDKDGRVVDQIRFEVR